MGLWGKIDRLIRRISAIWQTKRLKLAERGARGIATPRKMPNVPHRVVRK